MSRFMWKNHLLAALGYLCVAVAFSWPLLPHVGTHLTGDPGGDTGVYVWNQWVFQHGALAERRNPLTTEHVFSLSGRPVDLTQHNYTLFLNVLAFPLIGALGAVVTFNVVMLAMVVLTAWATFALARRVTGGASAEAWLAGLAFAWAPLMVARTTGHVSLVAAAPLAGFLWSLHRVERSERLRDSALAGLMVAWAAFCDPYFAVYCLMIAALYVASRLMRLEWRPTWKQGAGAWLLDLSILLAAGLVAGLAFGGGGRFEVFGLPVSVRGLNTPVLLLTVLLLARAAVALRPHVVVASPRMRSLRATVVAGAVGAFAMAPVLYGATRRMLDGTWVAPPLLWRSSPRGVDLLAFLTPNPSHPLATWWFGSSQLASPTHFVEYTASVSLVAIGVIVWAAWRVRFRSPGWTALTGVFAALALGPFIYVGTVNTFVPGPWALARYLPVVGMARTPTRFAIVAALGLSVLLALALTSITARWPARRRLILGVVGAAMAFELWPGARPLYSAAIPSVYEIVSADTRDVRLLELPFGVRDGVDSEGDFTARYQFNQTAHGKRLIGGYLSRVSARRRREVRRFPILEGLIRLSEGRTLTSDQEQRLVAEAPAFLTKSRVGWVVMHPSRTPPALQQFALRAFGLEQVAVDGDNVLYRPMAAPTASPP